MDKAGNVYVADYQVGVVRKVTNGTITTIAGIGATGYSGDGGLAKAAQLNGPSALAFDPAGNLYIAQLGDSRVRIVSTSGVITTLAGTGADGYQGEVLAGGDVPNWPDPRAWRPTGTGMSSSRWRATG